MTQTLEQPRVEKLDPDADYTDVQLADHYGVSRRQFLRWRNSRRLRFPKPYSPGRVPRWKGYVVIGWEERRQEEGNI